MVKHTLAVALVLLPACQGQVGPPNNSGDDGPADIDNPGEGGGSGGPSATGDRTALLGEFFSPADTKTPRPVGRLTKTQLQAVAQDIFAVALTTDELTLLPTGASTDATVSPNQYAEGVWNYAEVVAKRSTETGAFAGYCGRKKLQGAACKKQLAQELGSLLFRRALSSDETSRFSLLGAGLPELNDDELLQGTIKALLISPFFLFPAEAMPSGTTQEHTKLARLTLAVWDSLPDAQTVTMLSATAKSKPDQALAALLDDKRADRVIEKLASRFVDLNKFNSLQKVSTFAASFGKETQAALRAGLLRRLKESALRPDGDSFNDLMTSPTVYVNRHSAPLYGLASTSEDLQPLPVNREHQRAGLVGDAALMAVNAGNADPSLVRRGVFVLERLLCELLPPPIKGVPPLEDILDANQTQRQVLSMRTSSAQCAGCHTSINGIGFGLEAYDAIGRYMPTERGMRLSNEGQLPEELKLPTRTFTGPEGLGKLLASAPQAAECFVKRTQEALIGRPTAPSDAAELERAAATFRKTGSIRTLVVELLASKNISLRY